MERKATILRIEKISTQDGQGLRTVVFFKGCPLQCAWCSTPESQSALRELYYQKEKCCLCGRCVSGCQAGALSFLDNSIVRDKSKCIGCFQCAKTCPAYARKVYGLDMTVAQVMKQILRDEVFYFHSGGGVTLSGGDVLCHAEFARELLIACKESAIHTSAELDMFGDYLNIQILLPYLDSFYVDIKLMDRELHRKWTGVDNSSILENIKKASDEFPLKELHIRVPLIWDINDSRENLLTTAEFCKNLGNCCELEFLPYHRLGQDTYEYLNRKYELSSLPAMSFENAYERVSFLCRLNLPFPIKISGCTL